MLSSRESPEGERKRGEPGFVEVYAQDREFTHRVIRPDRTTDQGFGIAGREESLAQPVLKTVFMGTAKFHNTAYSSPDVIGEQIGGISLPALVHYLRGKQKGTGVTDDKRYTYTFPEPSERRYSITENGLSGRSNLRALTEAEIQQFQSLLRGGDTVEAKLALTKEALHDRMEQLFALKPRALRVLRNVRDRVAGWFKGDRN